MSALGNASHRPLLTYGGEDPPPIWLSSRSIPPLAASSEGPCECVSCCNGEHPGDCAECAGWGANNEEAVCSHCDGTGICPICEGTSASSDEGEA